MSNQTIAERKAIKRCGIMKNAAHNPPSIKYPPLVKQSSYRTSLKEFFWGAVVTVVISLVFFSFFGGNAMSTINLLVIQAHKLKESLDLQVNIASIRCQYRRYERVNRVFMRAVQRFQRRLDKFEWCA